MVERLPIKQGAAANQGQPSADNGRFSHRIREIALQTIIEATAIGRLRATLRTHASPAGEQQNYTPGELVDFWRKPNEKDFRGWNGPATILKKQPERGMVELQFKGRPMLARYGDVRRFMDFTALVFHNVCGQAEAYHEIEKPVESLPKGRLRTCGCSKEGN